MLLILPALVIATMPALFQTAADPDRATTRAAAVAAPRFALDQRDSIKALRLARRAQENFELTRRANLPRSSGIAGRACDVVVGPYCHWRQRNSTAAPPEEPKVVAVRERLVALLDSLGKLLPNDRWILAQRLRYLAEAGRRDEADSVVTQCAARTSLRSTRSWCRALGGYLAQERADYKTAEAAFASALAEMSDKERCTWQDLSILLDGKARDHYKRLSCAARDSMSATLWRLMQPLYLIGVNDMRTEFLARVTRTYIEKDSRTPLSAYQGADERETLLRFGGGLWYAQERVPPGSVGGPAIASFRRGPAFNFLPVPRALLAPELLGLGDWDFTKVASRTQYAPEYAQRFYPLIDHQLAIFRRGDSAFIVAAFDVSAHEAFASGLLRAGMFAAPLDKGGVENPTGTTYENARPTMVATQRTPWRPLLVSVEVLDEESRAAARARYAVTLPARGARVGLSDVLLYAPRDSTPRKLEDALPLALHTARVSRGKPLGLFWETYGVRAQGEDLGLALIVEPIGQSWFRRAAQTLRLADKKTPLSVQWREVPSTADGIASRGVAVDLSTLKPGRYRIKLSLTPSGDVPIVSMREIEVLP